MNLMVGRVEHKPSLETPQVLRIKTLVKVRRNTFSKCCFSFACNRKDRTISVMLQSVATPTFSSVQECTRSSHRQCMLRLRGAMIVPSIFVSTETIFCPSRR